MVCHAPRRRERRQGAFHIDIQIRHTFERYEEVRCKSCAIPVAVMAERHSILSQRQRSLRSNLWEGGVYALMPEPEYSLLNGSGRLRGYDQEYAADCFPVLRRLEIFQKKLQKERKENDKTRETSVKGICRVCLTVRRRADSERDAHHGGIPARRLLCGMGSHLPAVSDRGLYFPEEKNKN